MRLVHLSDIHLSASNYTEFKNSCHNALINDLTHFNKSEKPIDLILITGDLIDKGGHSLKQLDDYKQSTDPYDFFEKVYIEPICKKLKISKDKFLFVPGNHDIDENEILWVNEKALIKELNDDNIEKILKENKFDFNKNNERIKSFKQFENRYHQDNINYIFSNNESVYIHTYKDEKIGFLMINDSWRCSTCRIRDFDETHYIGTQQFYDGKNALERENTVLNIVLLHHNLADLREQQKIKQILTNHEFELMLYGHSHKHEQIMEVSSISACVGLRGRAALNYPGETNEPYQTGYQIIDIDIEKYAIESIFPRKYISSKEIYAADVETAPPDGTYILKGHNIYRKDRPTQKMILKRDDFIVN
ncbi:hypothetical protein AMR72_11425 [Flavobacterium psychrophilum]|nr:hypothetical protein AMR72_11425 [Flavobacterium psychrophilum]AOE53072.1 hypothetical protein ALW18_11415 [Flavobacterium psychrophilum]